MNKTEQDVINLVMAMMFSVPVIIVASWNNFYVKVILACIQYVIIYFLLRNISFLNRRLGMEE